VSHSRGPSEADEVLLRLVAEGNEAALRVLYERRSKIVYSLVLSIVHNETDAEEVTQEAFVKMWKTAASFDAARGSALAWITTMTRRLAIDRTRSKHYKSDKKTALLDEIEDWALISNGTSPSVGVEAREVREALGQLDENHSMVIRLSYFEGLSHSQISERLDTPIGTVKSRIREAVIKLRRLMGAD
jgi:RNA polymerase sigma-70 factor (ECF subfamily)